MLGYDGFVEWTDLFQSGASASADEPLLHVYWRKTGKIGKRSIGAG